MTMGTHNYRSYRMNRVWQRCFLKAVALWAVAIVVALATVTRAQADTMKLASATINDVQHEWQKVFADELHTRIGDAVTIELYPASQLGAIPRMAEGVLLGTIEAFTTPTAFMTHVDPRFQAFDVPGLFTDSGDVRSAFQDPTYRSHLETMFIDKGLRVIGAFYNSPAVVFSLEPVNSIVDMSGMKIRTFASPMQTEPMKQLGAIPLPLALSEVVPQLQNGGLDGMLVGMPILTAFKYYDIGKYVTDLRFAQIVSVTVVNEGFFQSQDDEVQQAIVDAGRAAEERVYEWGVNNVKTTYATWTENGGKVTRLDEGEQAAMMDEFAALANELVQQDDAVRAEYERLQTLVSDAQ